MARLYHHPKQCTASSAVLVLAIGCGGTEDRPPPSQSEADIDVTGRIQYDTTGADARDVIATGACQDGAQRECRIYLPSHNDVQPCFVGQQSCVAARWGACEDGVVVDANADDAELDPEALPE